MGGKSPLMFSRRRTPKPSEGSAILSLCRRAGPLVAMFWREDMWEETVTAGFRGG
jgi:hypothetical protein